ncbi:MAG TPA: hypothetical protein VHO02_02935 [Fibrobacteria bacterium]|nr:hypothetical protein [Fibrobacteria bacterium]
MPRPVPPPSDLSRRAFVLFALLAPSCLLAVVGIVVVLQYRQFQALVSPKPLVERPYQPSGDIQAAPDVKAYTRELLVQLMAFPKAEGSDTLALSATDLTMLSEISPVAARRQILLEVVAEDSLLVIESSSRVDALEGRFAGLFKRLSPVKNGWLNARVEGLPDWSNHALSIAPERSFLNGIKVPRAALEKRAGLSPKDFIAPEHQADYKTLLASLDTVLYKDHAVLLVRHSTGSTETRRKTGSW